MRDILIYFNNFRVGADPEGLSKSGRLPCSSQPLPFPPRRFLLALKGSNRVTFLGRLAYIQRLWGLSHLPPPLDPPLLGGISAVKGPWTYKKGLPARTKRFIHCYVMTSCTKQCRIRCEEEWLGWKLKMSLRWSLVARSEPENPSTSIQKVQDDNLHGLNVHYCSNMAIWKLRSEGLTR